MMKPWEAFGDKVESPPPPLKYNRIFVMIVVVSNVFIVAEASSGGWGAIGMLFIYGPIMNMILATSSLLLTQHLRKGNPELSLWKHMLVSLGVPTAAVALDILIISLMDVPGGC